MKAILYVLGWAVFIAVAFWLESMTIADRAAIFVVGLLALIASQLHDISKKLDKPRG